MIGIYYCLELRYPRSIKPSKQEMLRGSQHWSRFELTLCGNGYTLLRMQLNFRREIFMHTFGSDQPVRSCHLLLVSPCKSQAGS